MSADPSAAGPAVSLERLSDLGSRVALGGIFGWFGGTGLYQLAIQLNAAGFAFDAIGAAMPELAKRLFMLAIAIVAVTRRKRIAALGGIYPRVLAVVGTFFAPLTQIVVDSLGLTPHAAPSPGRSAAIAILILVGSLASVAVVNWLGKSFSIMPEARRLIVTGPYALVRHPLYVTEELVSIGFFLSYPWPWTAGLLALHIWMQIQRMGYEETILRRTFPEYDAYAARTARLIPGLY
jgi:protein-S-isoprenylcysteine O-methyltransferase Ste14